MSENQELIVKEDSLPAVAVTPMQMMQIAVQKGTSIEQLQQLMALQERWEANEARKAFHVALGAFKANAPELLKDKHVSFQTSKGVTEYKHATLGNVSANVAKSLSEHGLSHRWDVQQLDGGMVKVSCILSHVQGHSESTSMQSGLDQSGGKNNIQALGSVVTYLQRYTLLAASGLATNEQDDDGHLSSKITPTSGVASRVMPDETAKIDALAVKMQEFCAAGQYEDAVLEAENAALDADQMTYLWTQFDAPTRRELKKASKAIKERYAAKEVAPEQSTAIIDSASDDKVSDSQVKRLEAIIGKHKLKRDDIKLWCSENHNAEHFKDLTKAQYKELDAYIEGLIEFAGSMEAAEGRAI